MWLAVASGSHAAQRMKAVRTMSNSTPKILRQGAEAALFQIMQASAVIHRRGATELDRRVGDEVAAPSLTIGRPRKLKDDPYAHRQ